ncbi:ligand-binding sensor domain-containing diguanylate cyclase [Pseudoalteromonas luteoviolacea]|uniref:diguanylate cyclase n=1 Tax=Pseudoalteromonas luteoviolacea NCIMB 1942 TaxID=1365253 RepID=A0A166Z0D4_9GAMM|nr:ligand-binding sensor domain-containing diguanylate cyclase [Pseudoalteromonas luteoviolacea]KZN43688.1 diguanylate cyclase [Pseudoalteromonas luteoviolacea NCIMB 1942]KZX01759.1 diguanylate cyclase [Pseudoalteromonas luteoviolacea]
MRKFFLLLIMLVATSAYGAINDYVVKQWNMQNDLPSQSIKSVVQDQQGYIWLGTQFGLSRFDGHQFVNFNTQNSNFLVSNAINKLLVDRFGMLWVGTRRGVLRIDPQTMKAQKFKIQADVKDIIEDTRGNIWVAANGLYYISAKRLMLDKNNLDDSKLSLTHISQIVGAVTKMAPSPDGIWLVNERHLLRIGEAQSVGSNGMRLELSSKISLPRQLAQTNIHDLAWVDGKLYLASQLGAFFLDFDEVLRRFDEIGNSAVYKFLSDDQGGLWVSTYGRLLYKESGGEWQSVDLVQLDQGIWFTDLFIDKSNNVWLASINEGLWLAHAGRVERFQAGLRGKQAISAMTMGPKGNVWVATREGVGMLDQDDNYQPIITPAQLKGVEVHDMEFLDGRLYLGTGRGVVIYDDGRLFAIPNREFRQTQVFTISPSNQGGLWIGTGRGLYRLDYNGLTPFTYNAFLGSQFVTYVVDFPRFGFIGTDKGAYKYNERGIEKIGGQTSLESAYVTSILHVDTYTTLVGTFYDGLYYKTASGDWFQLDASHGLPYGPILSLHYDKKQHFIWVSSMKGVYRMSIEQFTSEIENLKVEQVINPFDRQLDGMPSQCCTGLGHDSVVEVDDVLLYPSLQGVVRIPKSVKLFSDSELEPRFEGITTPSRELTPNKIVDSITLDTNERDLTIRYTAIDFYAPQSIEFRYKLEGHDEHWRDALARREAIYTNLPPGEFTFKLEVKRRGEDWQEAHLKAVKLVLPRRFDETVFFRLIITCGFIFLFYLVFWVFRAQERRKQAALEALVTERTTELRKANEKLNKVNTQLKLVSHSDELTGLKSRRFLFDQLPKDIEHYQRNAQSLREQGKSLVLMILNIDKFSKVNDANGPIGGDSCLQQLATLLNTRTQGSDYVARWSGDEFLLLLRDFQCSDVDEYVKELCKAIGEFDFTLPNGRSTNMTVSVGWSFYPLQMLGGHVIGWEASVNLADIALHQVKRSGGDGAATVMFDDELDAFEFEHSQNVESQLQLLQTNGLAEIKVWMR